MVGKQYVYLGILKIYFMSLCTWLFPETSACLCLALVYRWQQLQCFSRLRLSPERCAREVRQFLHALLSLHSPWRGVQQEVGEICENRIIFQITGRLLHPEPEGNGLSAAVFLLTFVDRSISVSIYKLCPQLFLKLNDKILV